MTTGDPVIDYWDRRYRTGGNSGSGSRGELAAHKAAVVNDLISRYDIKTVSELGCGDGSQAGLLSPGVEYRGYDVSKEAIRLCHRKFAGSPRKIFTVYNSTFGRLRPMAELTLSLDVIYHILDDSDFHGYMMDLFTAATKLVAIYSSNTEDQPIGHAASHVRHRVFTDWIDANASDWLLWERTPQPWPELSSASFFVYSRRASKQL